MRIFRQLVLLAIAVQILPGVAAAIEIPLSGRQEKAETPAGTGTPQVAVAYVDMQRVFQEHPLTKRYQEAFKAEVNKRKGEIDDIDNQIAALNKMIVSSTTALSQTRTDIESIKSAGIPQASTGDVQTSSSTAAVCVDPALLAAKENDAQAIEAGIDKMRAQVKEKRDAIAAKINQGKEELAKLEEHQSAEVLADLYRIFDKISKDENLTIIFDKSNILYGRETKDITNEVLDRLRGR